jgi:hypothetical protein
MKKPDVIAVDYRLRMDDVLSMAWRVFKSQFVNGRIIILKEAPFQHHFAYILKQVGDLHSLKRDDVFVVDLETRHDDVKGKRKHIDITCEFVGKCRCAIELKFKLDSQGAQDWGRIDMYQDLEALEIVCKGKYEMGRFFAISDSVPYIKQSKRGAGIDYPTHDGYITELARQYETRSKGRENVKVQLSNEYLFEWEKIERGENSWYFLDIVVNRLNEDAETNTISQRQ